MEGALIMPNTVQDNARGLRKIKDPEHVRRYIGRQILGAIMGLLGACAWYMIIRGSWDIILQP